MTDLSLTKPNLVQRIPSNNDVYVFLLFDRKTLLVIVFIFTRVIVGL